jgi:hypothetical protein
MSWRVLGWGLFGLLAALGILIRAQLVEGQAFIGAAPLSSMSPNNSGGGGGTACGSEAEPAPAVAAGFTTCVMNSDWTEATGSDWVPYSVGSLATRANWLDCSGTANTRGWHASVGWGVQVTPCIEAQASDPTYGNLALEMPWQSAWASEYCTGSRALSCETSVTVNPGCNIATPSTCPYGLFYPTNAYFEATYRIDYDPPGCCANPAGYWSYIYQFPGIEVDFGEIYSSGKMDSATPTYSGAAGCNTSLAYGCYPWIYNTVPWDMTQYHTYGSLVTTDGANSMWICGYVDGSLINGSGGGDTNCVEYNTAPASAWQGYRYPLLWGISQGTYSGTMPTANIWYKDARIWSCPAWTPTVPAECYGARFVGSGTPGDGTANYWHQ